MKNIPRARTNRCAEIGLPYLVSRPIWKFSLSYPLLITHDFLFVIKILT